MLTQSCGLGFGEYHINGNLVTEDKFIALYSDYNKTFWYNTCDVTKLLKVGENIAIAHLGLMEEFKNLPVNAIWDMLCVKCGVSVVTSG